MEGLGMGHDATPRPVRVDRRTFLLASCAGLAGLRLGPEAEGAAAVGAEPATARSAILFFLCGGASHVDTWDLARLPIDFAGRSGRSDEHSVRGAAP